MPAPTFVGVAQDRNGGPEGTTSITLPIPSGADGDLLVAVLGVKVNPATTTPAGWTPIIAGFNGCTSATDTGYGIRAQLSAWWKIATASDTSVSFSFGPSINQASGGVLRYSGADPTTPIGPSACDKGASATPTAPSITTTTADNRVVRCVVSDADQAKSLFTAEPATQRFEIESTTVFGPGSSYTTDAVVTAASDEEHSTAGSTGTAAWTLPSLDQWAALTFAIQPPAGDDGGTDAEGCLALILRILRKILEAIFAALRALARLVKRLLGAWRNRRSSRR